MAHRTVQPPDEDTSKFEEVLSHLREEFEGRPDELIPMLQAAQKALRYLPEKALLEVARLAKLPAATVFGVATFYEQFRFHPMGRHTVRVCRGTACHVKGADRILSDIHMQFRVVPGETSPDRSFTLETVACFGSCAMAPVVLVDDSVKGRMNPSRTRKAIQTMTEAEKDSLKEPPTPLNEGNSDEF